MESAKDQTLIGISLGGADRLIYNRSQGQGLPINPASQTVYQH